MSGMQQAERLGPQDWMEAASTGSVIGALTGDGARAMFVGGCVRDAILGRPVKDIDIATELPPEAVMRTLEAHGVHAVPTGLAHGTVTAVVPQAKWDHFEITTLRVDVETYGRHARVAFTDDWAADARRRDFTLNAIFCDATGRVFDPVGGLSDLRAGRVRFVGVPADRIREDVLRILRFFRLYAFYGQGEPDPDALQACSDLAHLLPQLSGERVAGEILRLLSADDPAAVLALMERRGVLAHILPEATMIARLRALVTFEASQGEVSSIRRLAALLKTDAAGVDALADRLRLSNRERARLQTATKQHHVLSANTPGSKLKELLYRLGVEGYVDVVLLAWASTLSDGRTTALDWAAAVSLPERWPIPGFPLQGRDALAFGMTTSPAVGDVLAAAEAWWIQAEFKPDRAACLAWLEKKIRGSGS